MPRNHSLLGPTNSLINNIAANSQQPEPKIGMGCTELMYTDRYAYTIVGVKKKDGKTVEIEVVQDFYRRTDNNGQSESQTYEYIRNHEGAKEIVTLRRNGRWVRKGQNLWNGTTFAIGHRETYIDPSF